jgi:hypothetical protein
MPPISPECQPLADEVEGLVATKRSFQEELGTASPTVKPFLVRTIRELNVEIAEKQGELRACMEDHPVDVPEPLTTSLEGTVTVEIDHGDDRIRGPHSVGFTSGSDPPTLRLRFDGDRTTVKVVEMTPVETEPFDTPAGSNTTTVRRVVNEGRTVGSYDDATGHIDLPLDLHFDNSVDVPFVEEDAPVNFDLTTRRVENPVGSYEHVTLEGRPVDDDGAFAVVGESTFVDTSGTFSMTILGGRDVALVAEGRLSDVP